MSDLLKYGVSIPYSVPVARNKGTIYTTQCNRRFQKKKNPQVFCFPGLRKLPGTKQEAPCHPSSTVTLDPRHPPLAASINIWHLSGQNKTHSNLLIYEVIWPYSNSVFLPLTAFVVFCRDWTRYNNNRPQEVPGWAAGALRPGELMCFTLGLLTYLITGLFESIFSPKMCSVLTAREQSLC